MANNKHGWVIHSLGMQRLFETRGPESFQSLPERSIFQTSRLSIVFASLVLRRPTILSQERWKTVPWARDPEQKALMHHLVDILVDCPGMLADKDKVLRGRGDADALKQHASLCLTQLHTWKGLWDTTEAGTCYERAPAAGVPLHMAEDGTLTKAWETDLAFASAYHAITVTLYHATHILLLRILHSRGEVDHGINVAPEEFSAGIEICRTVEYHTERMREGTGSFFLLFPLRMAWESCGSMHPEIGAWLTEVLESIETGTVGRWPLAKYIVTSEGSNISGTKSAQQLVPP